MLAEQKSWCHYLARSTGLTARQISERIGCSKATAAKYIKAVRPKRHATKAVH